MLTREQMEQAIARGGSVLHQGRIISRVQDLPSAAELAEGDPERESATANSLQQQIADLQAQLAKLQEPKAAGKTAAKEKDAGEKDTK